MSQFDSTQVDAIIAVIQKGLTPGADAEAKAKAARACAGLASVLEAEAGTVSPGVASSQPQPQPSQHWMDRLIWFATAPEAADMRNGLLASLRESVEEPAPEPAAAGLDIPFIGNRRLLN